MFSSIWSASIQGMDGIVIKVEADLSDGLPIFCMVGYLASEVKEAKERVLVAIKNCGFRLPPKKITINLSPADIKKEGTAFDLPIAIAILASSGYLSEKVLKESLIIGELSLNGDINQVNGILPVVCAAKNTGLKKVFLPACNAKEGSMVEGISVIGIHSLKELVEYLNGKKNQKKPEKIKQMERVDRENSARKEDFSDIAGQELAKRAIEIAVSGNHHLLLIGEPGSGKTMLASRISTILPELTPKESLEISKVYSVLGLLSEQKALITKRPFRSPHHTITEAAMAGGGKSPKPGEISLASGGVLFLDEFPEFKRSVIEILRQPLEEKRIRLNRVNGYYTYPADFLLVAAMNPCPCGYYPDRKRCQCSPLQVQRYRAKISQALLDRIDICMEIVKTSYDGLLSETPSESSETIRNRILITREIQRKRYQKEGISFNSEMSAVQIKKYCRLKKETSSFMKQVFQENNLSVRGYHKILKTARTIADMEQRDEISVNHLREAVCYRVLEYRDPI